jgi:coproporphyrinogen III oxidase-like Fe-S oxidoreductase
MRGVCLNDDSPRIFRERRVTTVHIGGGTSVALDRRETTATLETVSTPITWQLKV